jgi:hypothetical protein
MFREDLDAARAAWIEAATSPQEQRSREESTFLAYEDGAARVVDFHALRHTPGSLLAASGAHPKVAQAIMRHSSIDLTMSRYTHVFAGQEDRAVAALPDLSAPVGQTAKATGTDNATAAQEAPGRPRTGDHAPARPMHRSHPGNGRKTSEKDAPDSASYLAPKGGFGRTAADFGGLLRAKAQCSATSCRDAGNPVGSGPNAARAEVAESADARDSKSRGVHTP